MPAAADGRLRASVEDWTIGYDLGALVQVTPALRIGVNYRSGAQNKLSGSASFNVPPATEILTPGGAFQKTSIQTSLPFSAVASTGAAYRINSYVTALADLSWIGWSDVQQLAVNFGNATPGTVQPLHRRDSWRSAIGAIFAVDGITDIRVGFAYDQTPIPDQFRTADLPQGDSILIALGFRRRLTSSLEVAGSYAYAHGWARRRISPTPTGGLLAGTPKQDAHSIGMQARLAF